MLLDISDYVTNFGFNSLNLFSELCSYILHLNIFMLMMRYCIIPLFILHTEFMKGTQSGEIMSIYLPTSVIFRTLQISVKFGIWKSALKL
jgi:hypothetical protein